jgi:hypothetical protein
MGGVNAPRHHKLEAVSPLPQSIGATQLQVTEGAVACMAECRGVWVEVRRGLLCSSQPGRGGRDVPPIISKSASVYAFHIVHTHASIYSKGESHSFPSHGVVASACGVEQSCTAPTLRIAVQQP